MNQPLFDGRGRWKKPQNEGGLSDAQLKYLFRCSGFRDLMGEFGYIDRKDNNTWGRVGSIN